MDLDKDDAFSKVESWLTVTNEQELSEDGKNSYYDRTRKNPQLTSFECKERQRQQKIVEQLANSDGLSFCRYTGMAKKKSR